MINLACMVCKAPYITELLLTDWKMTDVAPKIRVAYNNGFLNGCWIEGEEWVIHDYDEFDALDLSVWSSFDSMFEMAEFMEVFGRISCLVVQNYGYDLDEARQAIEERDFGKSNRCCFKRS